MGKDEGKIIINIDKAYNVNPAATVVNNIFNIGSGREAADAVKEAMGGDITPLRTDDILDLPEVANQVYKQGKQWGTNFNRDLVGNILYHLRHYKVYKVVYKDNYNGAAMCEALEGDREHSVKHALRNDPAKDIREAVDKLLKDKYNYKHA